MRKIDRLSSTRNVCPPPKAPKRYCRLCRLGARYVDYENVPFIKKFLNPEGKILHRRYTSNCPRHQKLVASSIKKGRQLAFLPYVVTNL